MTQNIVAQGLELMVYGMGTVVVFLALLVVVTGIMSGLVGRYFPEPQLPVPVRAARDKTAPSPGAPDAEVVAAISAAIRQHRIRNQ